MHVTLALSHDRRLSEEATEAWLSRGLIAVAAFTGDEFQKANQIEREACCLGGHQPTPADEGLGLSSAPAKCPQIAAERVQGAGGMSRAMDRPSGSAGVAECWVARLFRITGHQHRAQPAMQRVSGVSQFRLFCYVCHERHHGNRPRV
jgi:hypothetical protein